MPLVRALGFALLLVVIGGASFVLRELGHVHAIARATRVAVTPEQAAAARRDMPGLEDITLTTSDGLALRGWFAPGARRATIVFVHGGGASRAQLLPDATILARHGYGVLLYDSRAEGDSDGDLVTWGDREQRDVTAALDFVSKRPDVDPARIGIVGLSIGGSTVALAAARDTRAHAVLLMATWTTFEDEQKMKLGRLRALSWPIVSWGLTREGLDIDAVRPIDHIAEIAPRPLFMITGTEDQDTPVPVMQTLFAAAGGPKDLWIVPGAGHGTYVETAPAEYERRVVAFFDRAL